jgi:hypothetical protein
MTDFFADLDGQASIRRGSCRLRRRHGMPPVVRGDGFTTPSTAPPHRGRGRSAQTNKQKETSIMKRTKVLGLCIVALFAMSGIVAAQSSAIEYVWKVNGKTLESGQEKTLISKAKGTQVLKTSVIGVKVEIKCTEVKTEGAKIIGGKPGTSTETVEYKGCTVAKPSGCKIAGETIKTNPLKDEIVEGVGSSAGKALILFKPVSGETFAEPKLEGGFLCLSLAVDGSVLAEANPQKEEVTTGTLKFEPAEGKKYKNSKGEEKSAGLTVSGSASTVTGEVETSLSPSEKFGVF